MAVLGDCIVERRRGSISTALCTIDGEHWPYAWLLRRVHFVPGKFNRHNLIHASTTTD
jgi:hypothetical protein